MPQTYIIALAVKQLDGFLKPPFAGGAEACDFPKWPKEPLVHDILEDPAYQN